MKNCEEIKKIETILIELIKKVAEKGAKEESPSYIEQLNNEYHALLKILNELNNFKKRYCIQTISL